MCRETDHLRLTACVLLTLAGFIAGVLCGRLGEVSPDGGSRINWPAPAVPHPRSLNP